MKTFQRINDKIFYINDEPKYVRCYQDNTGEIWFILCDIEKIIGISFRSNKGDLLKYKTKIKIEMNNMNAVNMIGMKCILCKSRKHTAKILAKQLEIEIYNNKFECIESQIIHYITQTFCREEMIQQFYINKYKVDLYFPKHKLVVECDEYDHTDRNTTYEVNRQKYIETILRCEFIRFNPNAKNFNVFSLLNKIYHKINRSRSNSVSICIK